MLERVGLGILNGAHFGKMDLGAAMRPPPVPNPLRLLALSQGFGLRKIS